MPLPTETRFTLPEVRQVAARAASRFGVPFDTHLLRVIDDIVEDVVIEQALGPDRTKGASDA